MGEIPEPDLYFLKVELMATYVLQIWVASELEAIQERYQRKVPADSLYNLERSVTVNGLTLNEIQEKFEKEQRSGTKPRSFPLTIDS